MPAFPSRLLLQEEAKENLRKLGSLVGVESGTVQAEKVFSLILRLLLWGYDRERLIYVKKTVSMKRSIRHV